MYLSKRRPKNDIIQDVKNSENSVRFSVRPGSHYAVRIVEIAEVMQLKGENIQIVNIRISAIIYFQFSVNSNWVHFPPGNPWKNFFERANPGHPGIFCVIPSPGAKMMVELPGMGQSFPKFEAAP